MQTPHPMQVDHFHIRKSSPASRLLFFYTASFCGWIFEVFVFWAQHSSQFGLPELLATYRGVLHGPWAPIYGVGALLMVLLHQKIGKRPGRCFLSCMGICSVVEYVTAWALETVFHARWWDYTGYFLNLHGRICAMSVGFLSLMGMAVAYLAAPKFWRLSEKIPVFGRHLLCGGLTAFFLLDLILSLLSPNLGLGVQIFG